MLITFPGQLTSEEEQLLKKIAKMKKKKKAYVEKKSAKEVTTPTESAQSSTLPTSASSSAASNPSGAGGSSTTTSAVSATSAAFKRTSSGAPTPVKTVDAKEAAKKLIQSGVIKLETENKEKGFKRSCSRKDDLRKMSTSSILETFETQSKATYSASASAHSPGMTRSPPFSPGPHGSPFYGGGGGGHRQNSPTSYGGQQRPPHQQQQQQQPQQRFFRQHSSVQHHQQQQNDGSWRGSPGASGISLFVKANNNLSEEALRSLFGQASVSQVKVLSVDVKTGYAFVTVDTKESADLAIAQLDGKAFQETVYAVSVARPRKPFNRNTSYAGSGGASGGGGGGDGGRGVGERSFSSNFGDSGHQRTRSSNADEAPHPSASNSSRQIINYQDI